MDILPFLAEHLQRSVESRGNLVQFAQAKPVIGPQLRRPVRTVQREYGLASSAENMDVRRSMVVRIHDDPLPATRRIVGNAKT
jgi:hypothetical protein